MKDSNKLLKSVHSDLHIRSCLCGSRALGLINKFVTGPLWRLLESGIHVLDMNKHYQKMSSLFFDLSVDAKEFMLGNVIFFENVEISKDGIWWEQGILLSKDLSSSSDFIVNFFDNEDNDESESSLNVYEVLKLLLLDDYLNYDAQFL